MMLALFKYFEMAAPYKLILSSTVIDHTTFLKVRLIDEPGNRHIIKLISLLEMQYINIDVVEYIINDLKFKLDEGDPGND